MVRVRFGWVYWLARLRQSAAVKVTAKDHLVHLVKGKRSEASAPTPTPLVTPTRSRTLTLTLTPNPNPNPNPNKARGKTYYPPTYAEDGFTHATADPSKLLDVANHF